MPPTITAPPTATTLISALVAIYASSKVVLGVRMAMNTVFGVVETRSGLIERGISTIVTLIGLVAAVGIVVLMTFVPRILQWLGVTGFAATTGNWLLDWLIILVLIYASVRWVMHHAPNGGHRVPWTSPGVSLATVGIGLATWVFMVLVYDSLLLWLMFSFSDRPIEPVIVPLAALNPIDLSRILIMLKIDLAALLGYTGAVYQQFFGSVGGMLISFAALVLWIQLPAMSATRVFARKDL